MAKENRRVKMTKMLLNESLLKFLSEKPLSRITVKEICAEADVNRSTYYIYYTDPHDQMHKLQSELLADMAIYIDNIVCRQPEDSHHFYQTIKAFLDYIQSKKHVFQVLLSDTGALSLLKDMLSFFAERVFRSKPETADREKELQKYIFVSTGSIGMIYYWLMENGKQSTEELAKDITSFAIPFYKFSFPPYDWKNNH